MIGSLFISNSNFVIILDIKQKTFVRTVGGLLVATLLTTIWLGYLLGPVVRDENNYVAASLDKEKMLQTSSAKGRIVLVGGSNLALGVNSGRLSKEIGKPVVNMGLHAGLGLSFVLNEAQAGVRAGDTIILSIEYFLGDGDKRLQSQLVDVNKDAYQYVDPDPFSIVRLYTAQLQRCLSSGFYKAIGSDKKDPIYRRNAFTADGDLTVHWGLPPADELTGFYRFTENYDLGIERINQFIEKAHSKGCIIYFTYPAYPTVAYKQNKGAIDELAVQFKQRLKCPVLGTPQMALLPKSYFFDTMYHLTKEGTQQRTQLLAHLLRSANEQNREL